MKHEIEFSFAARYFTSGEKTTARQVWFVLHGYGQLAEFFLRKFAALSEENIYVIAPEGLSRFYLEDVGSRAVSGNNRVGATWMTREDRLRDIRNYVQLLNEIYTREVDSKIPVSVLGFSQGAATASRWVTQGSVRFERLILWGGIFPPDLELPFAREVLQKKEVLLVSGKQDPFMQEGRFSEMNQLANKVDISPRMIFYDGGHDIDRDTLKSLV